jgi:hypothetical protein
LQNCADQQLVLLQQQLQQQKKAMPPSIEFEICLMFRHSFEAMLALRRAHRRKTLAEAGTPAEEIEEECKAEDKGDVELYQRMREQNQVHRPLIVKAKCRAACSDGSGGGGSSNAPKQAHILKVSSRHATDAEMARAEQNNAVFNCSLHCTNYSEHVSYIA